LPLNVFVDLYEMAKSRKNPLELEERGDEWGHGRGIWLRYPFTVPQLRPDASISTPNSRRGVGAERKSV
jgi:hypothetical protein